MEGFSLPDSGMEFIASMKDILQNPDTWELTVSAGLGLLLFLLTSWWLLRRRGKRAPSQETVSPGEGLQQRLAKTHRMLVGRIDQLLAAREKVDSNLLNELEELLITADIGMDTAQEILARLKKRVDSRKDSTPSVLRQYLQEEILQILNREVPPLDFSSHKPFLILIIGVNGSGKTTSAGKLAYTFSQEGKKVLLAAADTFRAAAIEQLEIWGKRAGAEFISQKPGADPSAVIYDAVTAGKARGIDLVIADTAGRLHTKKNLMEELKKVRRIVDRELSPEAVEVFLVIDANNGQNAISQARMFNEALGVTGIILTKLDGTAKGGVILGITRELQMPIRYIGIGEGKDDLREFEAENFVQALFAQGGQKEN